MADKADGFEVQDGRSRRHAVVWMTEWDSARMRTLTYFDRCIYVTLCGFAGRYTGECFPKQETLAKIVGADPRSVRRSIARLKTLQYVEVELVPRGKRRINLYTVLSPTPEAP